MGWLRHNRLMDCSAIPIGHGLAAPLGRTTPSTQLNGGFSSSRASGGRARRATRRRPARLRSGSPCAGRRRARAGSRRDRARSLAHPGAATQRAGEIGGRDDGARKHRDALARRSRAATSLQQFAGGDELRGRLRRVVRRERSRSARRVGAGALRRAAQHAAPARRRRCRRAAAASGSSPRERDDRAFDADRARAAIENHRDRVAEIVGDVLRRRRRNVAEAVGRRRRDAVPPAANAASKRCATGCDGTRRPTLSWPPVTTSATCAARGRISVSGPGQNAAASLRAPSGTVARPVRDLR